MPAMTMLHFEASKCNEAIKFYESVFDSKVAAVITYDMAKEKIRPEVIEKVKELGKEPKPDDVFLASISLAGTEFLLSDILNSFEADKEGGKISVVIRETDPDKVDKWWNGLKEGAKITQDLTQTFWTEKFGALVDKYGIHWSITWRQHFYIL